MKKIVHIITGLNNGGAEGVLYRLCKYDGSAKHIVVSMMDEGKYGFLLKKEGIEVFCLNLQAGKISLSAIWHLYRFVKQQQPDVVQTWMYHADLIGGVVARLAGIKNVFWNIRHSIFDPDSSKKSTIFIAKLNAYLSGFIPKGIVCCANKAASIHFDLGYKKTKIIVIGNGYDLSLFSENFEFESEFKKELGVIKNQVLLGMVGRFDPLKNHFGVLSALAIAKEAIPDFKFALIGRDLNKGNTDLNDKIKKYGLESEILLLDQRKDIPRVMNGLDIHVLSSVGEAFPNVLAEAMACGTPCVTTDVGDAALIVGETGWVVTPKDPQTLASAIMQAVDEKKSNQQAWFKRKRDSRQRIAENFSIEKMVKSYHQFWFK